MHDSKKKKSIYQKTTFTKQAKEMLDISNRKSIACAIKENVELQMEEICFER